MSTRQGPALISGVLPHAQIHGQKLSRFLSASYQYHTRTSARTSAFASQNMAQTSPKQNISFSIDGILSSNSGDENLRRNRESCSKAEAISSIKATTTGDGDSRRGDNSPDIRTILEKQSGQFVSFICVVYLPKTL